MEAGLHRCIKEAMGHIFEELELQHIIKPGQDFDVTELYNNEEKYPEMWMNHDAAYWLGYLEGMADFADVTVAQIMDEYESFEEPEEDDGEEEVELGG